MVYLHQLPRWALPVTMGILLLIGMVVTGWPGALALVVLAVFLGWFAYLSWPSLDPSGRLLRLAALAVLLIFAAGHVVGQF
ncbi:MAG: hypothetical protein QOE54_3951 [Streptosporangiaceae bacterium]|jgi:hypothetical protein|nr:hypothetical protein [Streptosporangiaceae bacterium]MDX6431585.1 hypothetical protein [Streptosporangiaceae bacterium]